jgi:peptidoglycan/LPS O-acetylase OafA/YrhL
LASQNQGQLKSKRIYGLDILRAIAISTVLISHGGRYLPSFIYSFLIRFSIDGVSLFFVLSGFLIGGILLKQINLPDFTFKRLVNFWIRRWLRTLPAFFIVIIALLLWYSSSNPLSVNQVIKCITFTQNLLYGQATLYFESWSLAVEEWFYLLIPLLLFILFKIFKNQRKKVFLFTVLSVITICTSARIYRSLHVNITDVLTWDYATRRPVFLRLDSIMYGLLGAYLYYYKNKLWERKDLFFWIGIAIFIFIAIDIKMYMRHVVLSLECIGTLFMLPKLNALKSGRGVVFKFISFISIISYSLYLINATPFYDIGIPLINKILPNELQNRAVYFIYFLVWCLGGAYIIYTVIERPFMRMRKKEPGAESQPGYTDSIFRRENENYESQQRS